MIWHGGYRPYVSVDQRRRMAEKEAKKLEKKGHKLQPVVIEGRTIARTVWGKAWCEHLEQHCDLNNRLPRGQSYVRNGSVFDLQIGPGSVQALVCGSSVYTVHVQLAPLAAERWADVAADCAGQIDSLVALLQGKLSNSVLQRLCDPKRGLFPLTKELTLHCSCPDGAWMCKHIAAALYGVGNRLDQQPELLFLLRQVDQSLLLRSAAAAPMATSTTTATLADDDLASVFGLDMDLGDAGLAQPIGAAQDPGPVPPPAPAPAPVRAPAQARAPVQTQAADRVLDFLRQHSDREFRAEDVKAALPPRPRFTTAAITGALQTLLAAGQVEITADQDGETWWAAL